MFKSFSRPGVFLLSWILVVSLLSSCGARKEIARTSRGKSIATDASDMRNKKLSGSKMENYASLLGVSTRALKNKDLYNFIDSWAGSPHRMGGNSKSGVDCSGFVNLLYRSVYRKDLPRTSREMGKKVKRKYLRNLKEGDLVFFSFGGRNIDHVGVYLHNNKFVHVSTRKGVIISDIKDNWYHKYLVRSGTPKI
ncbi:MAG: C40 family peptidase [Sphingobacterium sp.]|uniref:C40 family peptidase n=1 Tax=Sphingobacterium sp. JB170 TaxID=1434842 RepID=UPI00097F3912|nr:NlpC/P60 family protein [Sphingobacterium sp. JB170]SJN30582.1 L-alanyl-gamma-D-glutamyl-L-diamino acid endopeptidase [Sphingobacterium sp. JB170]